MHKKHISNPHFLHWDGSSSEHIDSSIYPGQLTLGQNIYLGFYSILRYSKNNKYLLNNYWLTNFSISKLLNFSLQSFEGHLISNTSPFFILNSIYFYKQD